jgi:hypothetical protein
MQSQYPTDYVPAFGTSFGSAFGFVQQKDTLVSEFCNSQLDETCQTRFVTKYEPLSFGRTKTADESFQNIFGLVEMGHSYSFVFQTELKTLQTLLTFNTKRDLAYKIHNLRIIHIENSGNMPGVSDPYIITATFGNKSPNHSQFGFGFNQTNPGIEFSVYDMKLKKYTMLHYVDRHDMFQNKMSFDYNDYYFGPKRKFDSTRQEIKRQEVQSKRIREDSKQPKVETRVV